MHSTEKTPLKESNLNVDTSNKISISQPNLTNVKRIPRKEVVSDSSIQQKTVNFGAVLREGESAGNVSSFKRQNSVTQITSDMPGSPLPQLKTLSIKNDDINVEIKLTSSENVRLEVEIAERSSSEDEGGAEGGKRPVIREQAKSKLQRLGKLYAGGDEADISSPIHQTESKFLTDDTCKDATVACSKIRKGLNKLADLAKTINDWEDESQKVSVLFGVYA